MHTTTSAPASGVVAAQVSDTIKFLPSQPLYLDAKGAAADVVENEGDQRQQRQRLGTLPAAVPPAARLPGAGAEAEWVR